MIPIFLITPYLLPLTEMQWFQFMNQNYNGIMLYPRVTQRDMGLMTPCSSSDPVYQDYAAVIDILNEIPSSYIDEHTATGSQATITMLQSFLGTTDRTHVACHGSYPGTPTIQLNGPLSRPIVNYWSAQGYKCKLLFLSACNSMGHDGIQDNALAEGIKLKSGVAQVIGYKDIVGAGGAATFAGFFWWHHLWENGVSGGISSDSSILSAKLNIQEIISDQTFDSLLWIILTDLLIAVLAGAIAVIFPEFPWVYLLLLAILIDLYHLVNLITFKVALESVTNNVVEYGSSVPGLTYSSGGGGGGACPFLFIYSGGEYVDEGILDIHNPEGYDLIVEHALSTTPQLIDGKYHLRLTEESQHFSEIDQVQLVAILENGQIINRPLFAATHSEFGDVKDALLESDDTRMLLFGEGYMEHSESDYVDLLFMGLGPDHPRVTQWMFIIEGHNMKDM